MTNYNTITTVHVKKLSHTIEEIRLRALDNIISKFSLGFGCDCDAVKKELVVKLLNWFSFEIVPSPEKVLDLLLVLIKTNGSSYLNAFGKLRFQNELHTLRKKIGGKWHGKLNEIEETVLNLKEDTPIDSTSNDIKAPNYRNECVDSNDYQYQNDGLKIQDQYNSILPSTLDNSVPFDLTLQCGSGTIVSKKIEGGIKWLVMPWQPLVPSDIGVLSAVEETLTNTLETNLILHTCQFITNVMLQDFPAEVFLQRPSIVLVLHALLNSSDIDTNVNLKDVILVVLKALHKLTRSLRFRIYYYCDPCVANRKQKELSRNLESNNYASSEDRDSPDGGLLEANYQVYQSAGTSDRSHSVIGNVDESVLQLQQMLIPTFCVESLMRVISLLSLPDDPKRQLKINKHITDLSYELIQLLILSVMPNIWLCTDGVALKLQEELKEMLKLLSEVSDYFGNYSNVDHCRITYLHLITIITKLLSNIVPLELADVILPKELKLTICVACMDASIYLMYPSLHLLLQDYARQFSGNEEVECIKLLDETRTIIKSMKAALLLLKSSPDESHVETLKLIYSSKLSLSYHKNLGLIKVIVSFLQRLNEKMANKQEEKICYLCDKVLLPADLRTVGERSLLTIVAASLKRKDKKHQFLKTVKSLDIHKNCQTYYVRQRNIDASLKAKKESADKKRRQRLETKDFNFSLHCFFCGKNAHKQLQENPIKFVRSINTRQNILDKISNRKANEQFHEFDENVFMRLNNVNDLCELNARYHARCMKKFYYSPSSNPKVPHMGEKMSTVLQHIINAIYENEEECQFSLKKMLITIDGEIPRIDRIKLKLQEFLGDNIEMYTEKNETTICFKDC